MTRLEVANVLNKIMRDNNFSILDRDNCYEKFSDEINSLQKIFYLQNSSDFTYLLAVSHLLSDDENAINEYLLKENDSSSLIPRMRQPNRDDFLFVATAFEDNPEFFSMAWNWVVITENRIASKTANEQDPYSPFYKQQTLGCDIFTEPAAAATSKTDNLTYIAIEPLGELQIQGSEGDDPFITAILFLNPEFQKFKLEVKVPLEINGNEHVFVITKDSEYAEHDVPASNPWFTDYSKGYRIKDITWNLLK